MSQPSSSVVCLFTDDISAVTKIVGKEVTLEDGKQYMRTEKLLVDFTLGKSRFRIRDYINDGNILGKPKCETSAQAEGRLSCRRTFCLQSSGLRRPSPLQTPHRH
jgi:hypothetical protein